MATAKYYRKWRKENRERVKEYEAARRIRDRKVRIDYFRARRKRLGHLLVEKRDAWFDKTPGAKKAHKEVEKALLSGLLKRPSYCQFCGLDKRLHGHHSDYDKPLEVIWLCASCHRNEHLREKNIQ